MSDTDKNRVLSYMSEEDLKAELERRKTPALPPPTVLEKPNFGPLVDCIVYGTAQSIKDGYERDDFAHYVYEAAMEAVYGRDYWQWRKTQRWG